MTPVCPLHKYGIVSFQFAPDELSISAYTETPPTFLATSLGCCQMYVIDGFGHHRHKAHQKISLQWGISRVIGVEDRSFSKLFFIVSGEFFKLG